MARSRYCRACNDFHDLAEAWPEACYSHFGIVAEAAPQVIRDSMDPIRSMADGRMYDSKSVYRRNLRAAGCYEVGNDRMESRQATRPPIGPDIKRAIEQLQSQS